MGSKYDFSGWATRSNVLCSDGRVIGRNAFVDNNGKKVPLVWMHNHDDPDNVLGHAILENREDGVYAYCFFNSTPKAERTKALVEHGDVNQLSIYANQLKQNGNEVIHGNIREVSVVLASANPEAYIENVIQHGDLINDVATIFSGENVSTESGDYDLIHSADEPEDTKSDNADESNKQNPEPEGDDIKDEPEGEENNTLAHKEGGDMPESNEKTVGDVFNTLSDEQKEAVQIMIGQAVKDAVDGNLPDEVMSELKPTNNTEGGNGEMKHNAFEGGVVGGVDDTASNATLSHDAIQTIIKDAKRCGSMKESFLQHADEYGITNIEWLFPEARQLDKTPTFIKKVPDGWTKTVMSGVNRTPFSRIKMVFADITADEARAKGYVKGKRKIEEVFSLLKRKIDPTTVYKKQKLDRDDIIDITDFDVVSWMKTEMRMMLDEEIARAVVFGDGRLPSSDDKIDEAKIIPIIKDDSLYTITHTVVVEPGQTEEEAVIDAAVLAQVDYQGSGNLKAFMAKRDTAKMMLLQDGFKHRLYKNKNELALAMSVDSIEEVAADIIPDDIYAVIVDLRDYTIGADKGGAINMFDDFDIDYNQNKYLMETRCSGALTRPYSAIVLKKGEVNP